MGEQVKTFSKEAVQRWKAKMPKFFNRVMWLCGLISGTALAVNEAMQVVGIEPHEWWTEALRYLVAVPAGIAFACKFTVSGGMPEDKRENKNTILNKDDF